MRNVRPVIGSMVVGSALALSLSQIDTAGAHGAIAYDPNTGFFGAVCKPASKFDPRSASNFDPP